MPISSDIYGLVGRGVRSVGDYDAEAQQYSQNKLMLALNQAKLDEYQQGVKDQNALRAIVSQFGTDEGQNYNLLLGGGQLKAAGDYRKSTLEAKKTQAELDRERALTNKTTTETAGLTQKQQWDRHDRHLQALGSVNTPEDAQAWIELGVRSGVFTPEQAEQGMAKFAPMWQTPQGLQQWKQGALQNGLTALQQLERGDKARDFGLRAANEVMTPDGQGGYTPNRPLIGAKAAIAKAGASSVSVNTGQKGFDNESKLRNDFKGEPIVKEFADMKTAYSQIKSAIAQGTPIGDTAAATKIMKLLDPGSVVRESELGMAMAAAGKMDRLQNFVEMQIKGTKLTPTQRTEFGRLAEELMAAAESAYNAKLDEYAEFGSGYGLNTRVLGERSNITGKAKPRGGFKLLGTE